MILYVFPNANTTAGLEVKGWSKAVALLLVLLLISDLKEYILYLVVTSIFFDLLVWSPRFIHFLLG